jgi:hypothetical protein
MIRVGRFGRAIRFYERAGFAGNLEPFVDNQRAWHIDARRSC